MTRVAPRIRFLAATLMLACALSSPAMAASGPPAAAAGVIDCNTFAHYPNIKISSARNLSCRAAAREMRRYRGTIRRTFRTPHRFLCSRVSGGELGGQWRCVRGRYAFRFEFGD